MKNYDEDVLSVPAGKTVELIEKYGVYKCPNTDDYNYMNKNVLFWTFREEKGGAMRNLYQLKAVRLLPLHINEDGLRNLGIPEEDKNAIIGYQKEEKEKIEKGEIEWVKEHNGAHQFYIFDKTTVVPLPKVARPRISPQGRAYYRLCDILHPERCECLIPSSQHD